MMWVNQKEPEALDTLETDEYWYKFQNYLHEMRKKREELKKQDEPEEREWERL
jgi:hypothetical protein